jgi:hypothetical protein
VKQKPLPIKQLSEMTANLLPKSLGGNMKVTRACFELHHNKCGNIWKAIDISINPRKFGPCECFCHNPEGGVA